MLRLRAFRGAANSYSNSLVPAGSGTRLGTDLEFYARSRCAAIRAALLASIRAPRTRSRRDVGQKRETRHENRDGHHQAVQARRGARRPHRGRRPGPDRDRSQGLRPPEGPHRNLSRHRIRRELPAEDQDRGRRRRPTRSTRSSRRSSRPPRPARSATARSSSSASTTPCASAPARPTPTRCEPQAFRSTMPDMNIPAQSTAVHEPRRRIPALPGSPDPLQASREPPATEIVAPGAAGAALACAAAGARRAPRRSTPATPPGC